MSLWKRIMLMTMLGFGIGCIVPTVTYYWLNDDRQESFRLKDLEHDAVVANNYSTEECYHFRLDQEGLSVITGKPGVSGDVIITGLNVESWPKDILEKACEAEFYSLDEIQSFIDTAQESFLEE